MRYYLSFVALGLLMGGVCLLLEIHRVPSPAMAMVGLFGAHVGASGVDAPTAAASAAGLPA